MKLRIALKSCIIAHPEYSVFDAQVLAALDSIMPNELHIALLRAAKIVARTKYTASHLLIR